MKGLWHRLRGPRRKNTVVLAFTIPDDDAFDDWLISGAPWASAPVEWR